MGLFSSKKETVVNTSVTPLISDTPNLLVDSIYASVTTDRPIASDLLANILGSAATRANTYYTKGKNHYYYGLPEGTLNTPRPYAEIVKGVLREINNDTPVQLDFYITSPMQPEYIAYEWLAANREYDFTTGDLGIPPDIPDAAPNEPITYTGAAYISPTQISITYKYYPPIIIERIPASWTEIVTVDTTQGLLDPNATFYHVGYYLLNELLQPTGPLIYFNYNESTEMYPPLNIDENAEALSTYFPVVPVCKDGEDLSVTPDDPDSEEYEIWQSCYQQLRALGVSYNDIGTALFGPFDDDVDTEEAPDPKDLDYGFVILGSSIVDDRQSNLEYLFSYFQYLEISSTYTKSDYESWKGGFFGIPTSNLVTIKEEDYHVDFEYYYINTTYETGDLGGGVGHFTQEINFEETEKTDQGTYIRHQALIIRKQVSPLNIEVVTIYNPYLTTHIHGKYNAECDLESAWDDGLSFVIPLNKEALDNLRVLTYNDLVYSSMKLVINSVTTVKVKWYQSSWFKIFTTIVITIATFVFTGPAGGMTWAALLNVAVTALISFAIFQVVTIVANFILDVFGIENTFLATIIATAITIAAMYYTQQANYDLATLDGLMQSVNAVQHGFSISSEHIQENMLEDFEEHAADHKEQMEEIEELLEDMKPAISSEVVMESVRVGYNHFVQESPTDFISRTTMTNPGVLAVAQISSFTQRTLNIPGVSNYNSLNII